MDDLELANASIRRGARLAQVFYPGFAILACLYVARMAWQIDAIVPGVAVIVIALVAAASIIVQARRLSRFQLTVEGVYLPNGEQLPWNAITRAASLKGLLSLFDAGGREIRVSIMFATSQKKILAAIRARLPHGVQIEATR
jgi:hypothetical protein